MPAYVLLGDPGAGKTTAFEAECSELEDKAVLVSARDFVTFDPQDCPEWNGKTLFIDGLDEIRAGAPDARTPFDSIRNRLKQLGRPRFRLSCRYADWLVNNDRRNLAAILPDPSQEVTVLNLDPLTPEQAERLLSEHQIGDAVFFMREAEMRGVGGSLLNPMGLKLLAQAVAGGKWPKSRLETFEMACRQIVIEHNEEHLKGESPPEPDQLLDAAGHLCALQLLVGKAGFAAGREPAMDSRAAAEDYLAVEQFCYENQGYLRAALATKLFKAEHGVGGRFAPVHRHFAEFLGAGYLARIIDEGLPARRIVNLMVGEDGIVVTGLRGLAGWLAARCKAARAQLIESDPIGVGLYGDIRAFATEEKHALLKSLQREVLGRDTTMQIHPWQFAPLSSPDMAPALRSILADPDEAPAHQSFVEFVLGILKCGNPLPDLWRPLLDIVHHRVRWPTARVYALEVLLSTLPRGNGRSDRISDLLDQIQEGKVLDPDHRLLATMLYELYPDEIPPEKLWCFLHPTGKRMPQTLYQEFWKSELLARSSMSDAMKLLDSLQGQPPELQADLKANEIQHLPLRLLAWALKASGHDVDASRLYGWLSVLHFLSGDVTGYWTAVPQEPVGDRYYRNLSRAAWPTIKDSDFDESGTVQGDCGTISSWLENHPEAQKLIILEGLKQGKQSGDLDSARCEIDRRLALSCPPMEIGSWCLEQAVEHTLSDPAIAIELFDAAIRLRYLHREADDEAFLNSLKKHAETNEEFRQILERRLCPRPIPAESERPASDNGGEYLLRRQSQEQQWLEHVREHEQLLRQNKAPPRLLHEMASIYLGESMLGDASGVTGPAAIEAFLQTDLRLSDAVLTGLRGVLNRPDIPTDKEIIKLTSKNEMHYLGRPFLVALSELAQGAEQSPSEGIGGLPTDRIRSALAFFLAIGVGGKDVQWYAQLLDMNPEIVAEVQILYATSEIRGGGRHIRMISELALDPSHSEVARRAALPILRSFPVRCTEVQLQSLECLLLAAIQHVDRPSFEALIEKKLASKSMNDGQRVYWLAVGFLVRPELFKESLRKFVKGRERRIRSLVNFLDPELHSSSKLLDGLLHELGARELQFLVRMLGCDIDFPQQQMTREATGSRLKDSLFVDALVRKLEALPSKEATCALDSLIADPGLERWHTALRLARDRQRVIRRDSDYRHPTVEQTCHVLQDGEPANAGDLAALLVDRLNELGEQIRKANTDDWRQYWNADTRRQPSLPKHEEDCRDTLLSNLRTRLPDGCDAQPEGRYANEKRADIRVFFRDFHVPIEIKKSSNPDLWSGIHNQLMAKYASDPATGGYGIYLVFWLGSDDQTIRAKPPPSGTIPANVKELKRQLLDQLSEEERRKISVCAIDISPPG